MSLSYLMNCLIKWSKYHTGQGEVMLKSPFRYLQHKAVNTESSQENGYQQDRGWGFERNGGDQIEFLLVHVQQFLLYENDFFCWKIFLIFHHNNVHIHCFFFTYRKKRLTVCFVVRKAFSRLACHGSKAVR